MRLRARIEAQETTTGELRGQLETVAARYQTERVRLEERHAAAEARWLTEVDRARQNAKGVVKEQERLLKELRRQIEPLQSEREQLRQDLREARSELNTAAAVREQFEERLRAAARAASESPSTGVR